jgi:tetratricopeptide (TPR) repeat protein
MKAKALFNRGEYAQAMELLRRAAADHPEEAEIQAWLGHAHFFSGSPELAEEEYLKALRLNPRRWDAAYQAASIAFSSGRYREAAEYYENFLKLKVNLRGNPLEGIFGGDKRRMVAAAWLYQGLAMKELGEAKEARSCLAMAIHMDDTNPVPYGMLADLLMSEEDYAGAAEAYRRALAGVEDEESQIAFHNDLGVALFRSGELDQAAMEFKWVLKKDPKHGNAVYNLGVLYLKQGMRGGMAEDLKELMRSKEAEHILLGLTRSMVDVAQKEARDGDNKSILGNSPQIAEVHKLVRRAAATQSTVMILGENGTGKELVARAIHESSARRDAPFVAVNCGALPEALLESELFGYEKGAFTGADATKPGRFELAEGGTLFLDEIGDLAPVMQVKLLRVLQEHSYERLGSSESRKANVRIITATHRDLPAMMGEGNFREDLYYRLYVIPIAVPPLRDRGSDIDLLAKHFLARFSRANRKRFTHIAPAALKALRSHAWPGNVRELENTLERAVAI